MGSEPLGLFPKDHQAHLNGGLPQYHLSCVPSRKCLYLYLELSRKSTAEDRIS